MTVPITLLFITAAINSILSLFVLFGKRDRINITYSVFVLFASLWAVGLAFFLLESNVSRSLLIANFYYVAAAGIPVFFLYFSFVYPSVRIKLSRTKQLLIVLPLILLPFFFLLDRNFIIQQIIENTLEKEVVLNNLHYTIYILYFVFYVAVAYYNFYFSYQTADVEKKNQLKFVISGTAIGFIFGMVFNLFLPFFGNYRLIFLGPLFSFSMVVSIAYSITRHHLFDMKVVTTEVLTFVLWFFIFVRVLISGSPQDQIANGILFIGSVILGIFLIRSVINEVQQREKIEKLAGDLKIANNNLEKLNSDLESANNRLKELDQLKSEFLSLATHQIRSPLTAIKGYASLILEGDFGEISEPIKSTVQTIFQSCQNLVVIVNEFLDISRIEQGRMKYETVEFDVKNLCEEVLNELKPNIEKAGLTESFSAKDGDYKWTGDQGKIKQVIGNVIDNAIKYTPNGSITINLSRNDKSILIGVKDTGIGIKAEDIPKLFSKFTRTKEANRQNVIGTGLGLYVAKQMIEAQKGRVWVESFGPGKGSTFFVELPANK